MSVRCKRFLACNTTFGLKNAHQEVGFQLSKWIIGNLEKEQLLLPDEIEAIWREQLFHYEPPTKSIKTVSCSVRGGDAE